MAKIPLDRRGYQGFGHLQLGLKPEPEIVYIFGVYTGPSGLRNPPKK
jgi:hypothetical protein